ncbi:MAG: hypothetical protein SOW92_05785 [Kiritimatiellia bacterium]|nr:hypothetical protein [Kiritimatiellia bacterium]
MKKRLSLLALAAVLTGCMSPAPKAPSCWTVALDPVPIFAAATPKFGVTRLSQVTVRAPFDGSRLAVLRHDGSIAFDPFNSFAAQPAALLRGTAQDVLAASGLFRQVLHGTSTAQASLGVEIVVTRLALDCTKKGARKAVVGLTLVMMDGRSVTASCVGEGSAKADDGNFSAAFSSAFTAALAGALSKL